MLFDLRGKRKRLVQVIYASLALLMGGGLVLFGIGGEVSGGLLDAFTNRQSVQSGDLVKEAERLQERADAQPGNEQLKLRLIRARNAAGNALYEIDDSGQQVLTPEASEQFERAADAWDAYLQLEPDRVDPNVALLVANGFFALAQGATDGNSARSNALGAADAQAHFAEARPSVGSFSALAIYSYFGNDFERGDAAAEKVVSLSKSPAAEKRNRRQMQQYRKQAKTFQKQLDEYNKATQAGGEAGEAPQLANPSGGLSGSTP